MTRAQPLAVSMGDPAGIGPEIIAKAWDARVTHRLPPFVAIGDARAIERVWQGPIARIADMSAAAGACDAACTSSSADCNCSGSKTGRFMGAKAPARGTCLDTWP